jgi:hypothetical protein
LFDVVGRALIVAPEQIAATCVKVGVKIGLTVTVVAELVAEQLFEFVTVTVYEPEVETVIEEVVAPLLHKYVKPVPVFAFNTTLPPSQKVVAEPAVIVAVGDSLISKFACALHAPAAVEQDT